MTDFSAVAAVLDQPVWSALNSRHEELAQGGALARRYPADISPFAAVRDFSAAAFDALRALMRADEQLALVSLEAMTAPPGFVVEAVGPLWQMVAPRVPVGSDSAPDDSNIIVLNAADAPAMLELATLTKPGPFASRTHELGDYIGIRAGGRLVAMAGERMQLDGHAEISAVCVHPDQRGQGHARALMRAMMRRIRQRGDSPFLHVFTNNHGAIALYEELGFVRRQMLHAVRLGIDQPVSVRPS